MMGDDAATAQAQLRAKFSDATTIIRNVTLERLPDANIRFPRLIGGQFRVSRDGSETQFDVVSDDFVRGGSGATGGVSLQDTIVPPPAAGGNGGGGGNGGTTGVVGTDVPGADLSGTSMFASYLRNLRERNVPTGLASTLLERQSYPSQQTFLAENELANLRRGIGLQNVEDARKFDPATANATFEQFLGGLQPGFAGIGGRTRDAFSQFADLARRATEGGPRMVGGASGMGGLTDLERIAGLQYARPDFETEQGEATANMLSNLARQSAISGFNPIVGQRLFGGSAYNPGRLQADFLSQQGTAGLPSSNFADFLRQRFGQPAVRSGF